MTTTEQLTYIRSKCVKANGSILDLVFGCKVKVSWDAWGEPNEGSGEYCEAGYDIGYVTFDDMLQFNGSNSLADIFAATLKDGYDEDYEYTFEIIGRPIQLSDVFLAIRNPKGTIKKLGEFYSKRDKLTGIEDSGEIDLCYYLVVNWDLSQDLDHQSPECIQFLYELLS